VAPILEARARRAFAFEFRLRMSVNFLNEFAAASASNGVVLFVSIPLRVRGMLTGDSNAIGRSRGAESFRKFGHVGKSNFVR